MRLNLNIFIVNEVRLGSGKVLKGWVDEMGSNETFILFFKEEMLGKILTMKQVKIKWTY